MNAHPASSVEDLHAAIRDYVLPVRERVCPGEPFAIAPHIGTELVKELSRTHVAEGVGSWLRDHGLHLYTINAFPLQDFHARRVKDGVFSSDGLCKKVAAAVFMVATLFFHTSNSS